MGRRERTRRDKSGSSYVISHLILRRPQGSIPGHASPRPPASVKSSSSILHKVAGWPLSVHPSIMHLGLPHQTLSHSSLGEAWLEVNICRIAELHFLSLLRLIYF